MIHFTYHVKDGYILSLTELVSLLSGISAGDRQWRYALTQRFVESDRTVVTIRFSNALYASLPNDLSFHFPLLRRYAAPWDDPDATFVCLHPESARVGQHGLYFEENEVKGDCLYDWEEFWPPIQAALTAREPSPSLPAAEPPPAP
jgi:hypothetical protein